MISIPLRTLATALTIVCSLGFALSTPDLTRANGIPQLVKLTYMPELSNYGPASAEGVVEFSFSEGYLTLDATGLEPLQGAFYQAWLVRSSVNDALSVGTFNAAADGSAHFSTTLPPTEDYTYDLFILTVEPDPDESPEASDQRSIGGFFAVVSAPEVTPPGAETQPAAGTGAGAQFEGPASLPNTGDEGYVDALRRGAFTGSALAAAMAVVGISIAMRATTKKGNRS